LPPRREGNRRRSALGYPEGVNGREFRQRIAGLLGRKRKEAEEKVQKKPPAREMGKPEPKRGA
jgi:hypothetical protein